MADLLFDEMATILSWTIVCGLRLIEEAVSPLAFKIVTTPVEETKVETSHPYAG